MTESINKDLARKLAEVCGNEIDCTLVEAEPKCETISTNVNESIPLKRTKRNVSYIYRQSLRRSHKFPQRNRRKSDKETEVNKSQTNKEKFVIKFKFIGKFSF